MQVFKYGVDTLTVAKAIDLSTGKLIGIIDDTAKQKINHFAIA